MNKQDLVTKLKQMEGLTADERAYLTNLINTKKKYGLVWEDKPEDAEELLRTHLPVLREVVERRIASPSPSEGGEKETPPQPSPQGREQDHSAQTQQLLFGLFLKPTSLVFRLTVRGQSRVNTCIALLI